MSGCSAALSGCVLDATFRRPAAAVPEGVIAGAIRWDAWYRRTDFSAFAQNDLGPKKFHYRAPLHCRIDQKSVDCTGSQDEMDAEITIASASCIKFWAFVWYPSDLSLRDGWNLYQNSRLRDRINWCGIVATDGLVSQETLQQWADYMVAPNYQKINVDGVENRPLFFILWHQDDIRNSFGGDLKNVAKALRFLREQVVGAGLGPPYVVILDGVEGARVAPEVGAEAISNYISGFRKEPAAAYGSLDVQTRSYWTKLQSTGAPIVPIAMIGWDTRPRHETPGPWYSAATQPDHYYALGTPGEFAEHIRAAVRFIRENPRACPSNVLLIYSWDECDEGGCLMPTHGDPSGSHLSAIAPIIK